MANPNDRDGIGSVERSAPIRTDKKATRVTRRGKGPAQNRSGKALTGLLIEPSLQSPK